MPPMLASVRGRLSFSEGCLRIDNGNFAYPVVWAAGTTWDEDAQRIKDIRAGGSVSLTENVELQGGAVNVNSDFNNQLVNSLPEQCLGRVWIASIPREND